MGENKTENNKGYQGRGNQQHNAVGNANDKPLTEGNYVEAAERSIKAIREVGDKNVVTTSQLRNLLALTMEIYNELIGVSDVEHGLSDDLLMRINYLKLRFVYECGRTPAVKTFVEKSYLLKHLEDVLNSANKRKSFILFTRYMEALVAYRKYLVHFGD